MDVAFIVLILLSLIIVLCIFGAVWRASNIPIVEDDHFAHPQQTNPNNDACPIRREYRAQHSETYTSSDSLGRSQNTNCTNPTNNVSASRITFLEEPLPLYRSTDVPLHRLCQMETRVMTATTSIASLNTNHTNAHMLNSTLPTYEDLYRS